MWKRGEITVAKWDARHQLLTKKSGKIEARGRVPKLAAVFVVDLGSPIFICTGGAVVT